MNFSIARCGALACVSSALLVAGCSTNVPAPVADRGARPVQSANPWPTSASDPRIEVRPDPRPDARQTQGAPAVIERAAPPAMISGAPIGAASGATPLPPVSAGQSGNTAGSQFHVVQRGENLYRIALNNGVDLNALAEWNGITPLTPIREGQVLRLRPAGAPAAAAGPAGNLPPGSIVSVTPAPMNPSGAEPAVRREPRAVRVPYSDGSLAAMQREQGAPGSISPTAPASAPGAVSGAPFDPSRSAPPATVGSSAPLASAPIASAPSAAVESDIRPGNGVERDGLAWTWPTTGRVSSKFNEKAAMKGIDIAASTGSPVVAAAAGKVIYVGKEPRGYGQMIVVSHAKETVSVYFHTDKVQVREQQRVTLGQRLAEVSDTSGNKMHFEVRRQGRPIDPITLMPARN
ncbi:MAG: LysM peptidoglycan-binding domain-containing protein [Betaproteobacteria bacterium]|nr:MAG: LysM peptidoglycan-binding domain-containing protein [Betaproteobacteria bacterium]